MNMERNLFCKYYDKCLSIAAYANRQVLGCATCSRMRLCKNIVYPEDVLGCAVLLAAIFSPEYPELGKLYHEIQEERKRKPHLFLGGSASDGTRVRIMRKQKEV